MGKDCPWIGSICDRCEFTEICIVWGVTNHSNPTMQKTDLDGSWVICGERTWEWTINEISKKQMCVHPLLRSITAVWRIVVFRNLNYWNLIIGNSVRFCVYIDSLIVAKTVFKLIRIKRWYFSLNTDIQIVRVFRQVVWVNELSTSLRADGMFLTIHFGVYVWMTIPNT